MVALLGALWLQKRAKYDRNSVKIAIFRRKLTKIIHWLGTLLPLSPLCNTLDLHRFVQHGG